MQIVIYFWILYQRVKEDHRIRNSSDDDHQMMISKKFISYILGTALTQVGHKTHDNEDTTTL